MRGANGPTARRRTHGGCWQQECSSSVRANAGEDGASALRRSMPGIAPMQPAHSPGQPVPVDPEAGAVPAQHRVRRTMARVSAQPLQSRRSRIQKSRSAGRMIGCRRLARVASCWRRARFSITRSRRDRRAERSVGRRATRRRGRGSTLARSRRPSATPVPRSLPAPTTTASSRTSGKRWSAFCRSGWQPRPVGRRWGASPSSER